MMNETDLTTLCDALEIVKSAEQDDYERGRTEAYRHCGEVRKHFEMLIDRLS